MTTAIVLYDEDRYSLGMYLDRLNKTIPIAGVPPEPPFSPSEELSESDWLMMTIKWVSFWQRHSHKFEGCPYERCPHCHKCSAFRNDPVHKDAFIHQVLMTAVWS